MRHSPPRTDVVPIIGVAVIAALVTYQIATARFHASYPGWASEDFAAELAPLIERYGQARESQWYEELMIRDFFQDRRDGVFLDVGAFHYRSFNNTYYLETALGWAAPTCAAHATTHDGVTRSSAPAERAGALSGPA